jgi:DNA-binding response OmpR family regulator
VPKVLIVDDDADIVMMLVQVLQDEGYAVRAAVGEEALALAADDQPDVILLDIMMPGMDGVEVCRRLRANPKSARAPVIAMSASHRLRERASQMDVDGLLAKPFDLDELLANIERLLISPPRDDPSNDSSTIGR